MYYVCVVVEFFLTFEKYLGKHITPGLDQIRDFFLATINSHLILYCFRAIALLPNANTMCMVRDRLPIDLVYTDLIGLKHFQRNINEGFGKFRYQCHLT